MTVYYTQTGLTYHYSRECIHLNRVDSDRIKTADETELERSVCRECEKQRETTNHLLAQISR